MAENVVVYGDSQAGSVFSRETEGKKRPARISRDTRSDEAGRVADQGFDNIDPSLEIVFRIDVRVESDGQVRARVRTGRGVRPGRVSPAPRAVRGRSASCPGRRPENSWSSGVVTSRPSRTQVELEPIVGALAGRRRRGSGEDDHDRMRGGLRVRHRPSRRSPRSPPRGRAGSRPRGGRDSPRAAPPSACPPLFPRETRTAAGGNGVRGSTAAIVSSSWSRDSTRISAARSGADPGKHLVYQAECFRNARMPASSPMKAARRRACFIMVTEISPKSGGSCGSRPANTSARSRNSQGRPRQPRPTTTPSQPVCRIIRSASWASQMSPLPSTGMRPHGLLELGDGVPVGLAVVELRRGARVQGDGGAALVLGDPAGLEEGEQVVVDALAELDRDGDVRRPSARPPLTMLRSRFGFRGRAAPPPLRRDLADRAAEVHVDVVDPALADQHAHGFAHVVGIDAVELEGPHGSRPGRSSRADRSSGCRRRAARAVIISLT